MTKHSGDELGSLRSLAQAVKENLEHIEALSATEGVVKLLDDLCNASTLLERILVAGMVDRDGSNAIVAEFNKLQPNKG